MADEFTDLHDAVAARLAAHATLAPIAMITEKLGDISDRIEKSLSRGGIMPGDTGKSGLAILILTPSGGPADEVATQSQSIKVRVSVFCKPVINAGATGHQLAPLAVLNRVIKQLVFWNRGAGLKKPRCTGWDSIESQKELTYFADFEFGLMLAND